MSNSKALSHLILAGTGIYCLIRYHVDAIALPCGAYLIIIAHNILGIWHWKGGLGEQSSLEKVYHFTSFLQDVAVLPLIVCNAWLSHGSADMANFHGAIPLLPVAMYILDMNSQQDILDLVTLVHGLSYGYVTLVNHDYCGVAAAAIHMISYFYFGKGYATILDLSHLESFNYGLSFFCYFVLRSITGHGSQIVK